MILDIGEHEGILSEFRNDALPLCIGLADNLLRDLIGEVITGDANHPKVVFLFAFSSLRSAVLLTKSGQFPHSPPVQRQAIEALLYGLLFYKNDEWLEIWKQREEPSQERKFRDYGLRASKENAQKISNDAYTGIMRVYDDLIDFGAHPNIHAIDQFSWVVSGNVSGVSEDELNKRKNVHMKFSYLLTAKIYENFIGFLRLSEILEFSDADLQRADAVVKAIFDFVDILKIQSNNVRLEG